MTIYLLIVPFLTQLLFNLFVVRIFVLIIIPLLLALQSFSLHHLSAFSCCLSGRNIAECFHHDICAETRRSLLQEHKYHNRTLLALLFTPSPVNSFMCHDLFSDRWIKLDGISCPPRPPSTVLFAVALFFSACVLAKLWDILFVCRAARLWVVIAASSLIQHRCDRL